MYPSYILVAEHASEWRPGAHLGSQRVVVLPDNESRYETRLWEWTWKLRDSLSAPRDAEKEFAWCKRVVENAREWFRPADPEPAEPLQPSVWPGPTAPHAG